MYSDEKKKRCRRQRCLPPLKPSLDARYGATR